MHFLGREDMASLREREVDRQREKRGREIELEGKNEREILRGRDIEN